ncbi:hypothetical protein ACTXT7_015407 [Hymenolepis weldensis]
MSRSKPKEEKVGNRKVRSPNWKESDSRVLLNSKSNSLTGADRSRIRKPHRKGRSDFFGDIGSEFCKRLCIGLSVFCCVLAVLYFEVQYNQASKRQRQFYTPIDLPTVIGQNGTAPDHNPELFWGTYRPNIFFGMSHRSPHSMLFGLAWVAFDGQSIAFRHQCTNDGDLKGYNWIEHDGRNYGIQAIISGNHNITVAFVKRPNTPYGGDWTARISVSPVNKVTLKCFNFQLDVDTFLL